MLRRFGGVGCVLVLALSLGWVFLSYQESLVDDFYVVGCSCSSNCSDNGDCCGSGECSHGDPGGDPGNCAGYGDCGGGSSGGGQQARINGRVTCGPNNYPVRGVKVIMGSGLSDRITNENGSFGYSQNSWYNVRVGDVSGSAYKESGSWKWYTYTDSSDACNGFRPKTSDHCRNSISGCSYVFVARTSSAEYKCLDFHAEKCAVPATPTFTPVPVPVPVCLNVKLYRGGVEIQPNEIQMGDQLQIAVAGTGASQGRIGVNGATPVVTTTKNAADEFVIDYTVPAAGGAINIDAWVAK